MHNYKYTNIDTIWKARADFRLWVMLAQHAEEDKIWMHPEIIESGKGKQKHWKESQKQTLRTTGLLHKKEIPRSDLIKRERWDAQLSHGMKTLITKAPNKDNILGLYFQRQYIGEEGGQINIGLVFHYTAAPLYKYPKLN